MSRRDGIHAAEAVEMGKRIEFWPVERLVPYAKNARTHSAAQVSKVASSIIEFGFTNPILVDDADGIIAGHCRLMAAKSIGMKVVPVIPLTHMTPAQRRAYVLADNRLALEAGWDMALLAQEFAALEGENFDMALTGFDDDEIERILNPEEAGGNAKEKSLSDFYTKKIEAIEYAITRECPAIADLIDRTKTDELLREIESANITSEARALLVAAAERHTVFSYQNIAEFYAHADAATRDLLERSALVIIDFDKAADYGYVLMSSELEEQANLSRAAREEQ